MNRMNTRKYKLLQAVLASSCLIMPGVVFGNCEINNGINQGTCNDAPYNGPPYISEEDGATIIISEDGAIRADGATAGLSIIHKNNTINILGDAAPTESIAINTTILPDGSPNPNGRDGIQVQEDGAVINVGINREIRANENGIGIDADASNVVVNNSGFINGVGNGVEVSLAENTIINNTDDGVIGGGDDGIHTSGENTTINNSGLIEAAVGGGGFHAIHIDNGAKNAVINNLSDGVIQTDNGNSDVIEIHEEGATITNSGQIIAKQGLNAIDVQKNFKNITNNAGGLIESSGDGIIINGGANVSGNIINSGTIQVTGNGNAINITDKLIGSIINNASGIIQTTAPNAAGDVIFLNNSITSLSNSGDILATGGAQAIEVNKNISGNINNQAGGSIISEDGTTIHLANGLNGSIFNAGEIRSVTDVTAAPLVSGKAVVLKIDGGTVTGNITNAVGGEISTGNKSAISLNGTTINKAFVNNGTILNDSADATILSKNGSFGSDFVNSGTILNGTGKAIHFEGPHNIGGDFINDADALIGAGDGSALVFDNVTIGKGFENVGKISNDSNNQTVVIGNGSSIANNFINSGEIVNADDGIALEIDTTQINGYMSNSGLITTNNESAIYLNTLTLSDFFENSGTIGNDSINATILSKNGSFGSDFINTGTILNETGKAVHFEGSHNIGGDFINDSGALIEAGDGEALVFDNVTIGMGFENAGKITNDSLNSPTILASGNTKITNHFTNTGTIENLAGANSDAIDFSGANVKIKLIQNDGSIIGDVQLSDAGGEVLDLNGGIIKGDIYAGASDDTVNIRGGSYKSLDGGGGNNTLNIKNTFTTTGPISNFQTINVEPGDFTVTKTITNVDAGLVIKNGATVIATDPIKIIDGVGQLDIQSGGTLHISNSSEVSMGATIVDGILNIESNGKLSVNGDYTQKSDSILNVELLNPGPGNPIFIDVTGQATFEAGSSIHADVGGFPIKNGAIYDILSAGAPPDNKGILVSDSSAALNFTTNVNGNTFQLIADVVPFAEVVAGSEITEGVAGALDEILNNSNLSGFDELLAQLQTFDTADEIEDALRTLVPNYNHSLAANSLFSVHRSFDDIGMRLEELLGLYPLLQESDVYRDEEDERSYNYYNRYGYGYNYGDGDGSPLMRHRTGSWVKPYASIIDQRNRDTVDGYKADSVGFSAGADWRILDWATIGLAFNYGKTDVTQRGMFDNKQKINSYQFTFYGAFDPIGPIYVNTLIGLGWHNYKTNRAISVGTVKSTAQSDFNGLHYAGKLEVGYAWFNGKYYISPLASVRYTYLELDNYTDDGAGGLNLSTRYEPVTELLGSLGIKFASKNEYLEAVYVPELAAYINYDFQQDRQETLNNFLGGGPSFKSYGIKPAQTSFVVSPSLRMHSYRNFMFKIAYEFEAKKQFIAHSAYLKWYYKWD